MLQKISRVVLNLLGMLGLRIKYKIGDLPIRMNASHLLPLHQKLYPRYDRFLPCLTANLPPDSIVVDVGANIGDTFIAMWQTNPKLEFVCIEADHVFFNELSRNVKHWNLDNNPKVHLVNKLVGTGSSGFSLVGKGGTKHKIKGGDLVPQSLNQILANLAITNNVSLIKSDVDGFDYDVLNSASDLLKTDLILFFECDYRTPQQYSSYRELIDLLFDSGFCEFAIFDNFGTLIGKFNRKHEILQLMHYIYDQNCNLATRTINYFDILAYKESNTTLVTKVLEDYKNKKP
jgi:FkbM family methyltransferase